MDRGVGVEGCGWIGELVWGGWVGELVWRGGWVGEFGLDWIGQLIYSGEAFSQWLLY